MITAGVLLLMSSCENVLDTKVTWQIGDDDVWRIPELAMGVLHKAYNGISNRPDCYAENFLDAATDNAVCTQHSASVYLLGQGAMTAFNNPIGNWATCYSMLEYINSFLENGLGDNILYNREDPEKDAMIKNRLRGEAYFLRHGGTSNCSGCTEAKALMERLSVYRSQTISSLMRKHPTTVNS